MTNRTARRPWERLTSMPPAARAGRWLGAGGRSRRLKPNTGRLPRRITYQHTVAASLNLGYATPQKQTVVRSVTASAGPLAGH